jgi:hypothetical protein
MEKIPWRTGPDRHGQGVKAVRKIEVHGKRATVWCNARKWYAVTFDSGTVSQPPTAFLHPSQAVAIHTFREENRC